MPIDLPPIAALREFLGATTRHTRRIEIYESDGTTRWVKDTEARLKDGSVTVDYDRDERRGMDLTLNNSDGVLVNAPGEFWYDKIIKIYRGVQVRQRGAMPKVLIIVDRTDATALAVEFRDACVTLGFGDVRINPLATNYALDIAPYDIIVALGGANKGDLLEQAYDAGKSVFVFRESAQHFYESLFNVTGSWTGSALYNTATAGLSIAPQSVSDPRTLGWSAFTRHTETATPFRVPSTTTPDIFIVGFAPSSTQYANITSGMGVAGGRFVAVHYPLIREQFFDQQFRNFLLTQLNWLNPVTPIDVWETQIGEFMIDRISEPHRPREIKITGRDYTKKLILSKFPEATQFAAGQPLEQLVGSIAGAGGVSKRLLPPTAVVVGRDFFFERGTSRWEAIKEICTAYSYEVFFDAAGYLTMRPFRDPSTSAPILWIQTGKEGQVASYSKSTSDARIFNRVLVVGENSDSDTVPVWAQAVNDDPDSPTNIYDLGDRYIEISSAFVETVEQAQDLAAKYLSINALEEFELSFETLMLPWLEVGDILGWIDPKPDVNDPNTFLLSNISIPLSLGPMSGTGRRITTINASVVAPIILAPNVAWKNLPDNVSWRDLPDQSWNLLP